MIINYNNYEYNVRNILKNLYKKTLSFNLSMCIIRVYNAYAFVTKFIPGSIWGVW